jgi:hypothetical protein
VRVCAGTSFILMRSRRQKLKACRTCSPPRLLSNQEWMEEYGGQPAAEANPEGLIAPASDA